MLRRRYLSLIVIEKHTKNFDGDIKSCVRK
jgi:hypothetical protein